MMVILIITFSGAAQADVVEYTLENVIQTDGSQFSGNSHENTLSVILQMV